MRLRLSICLVLLAGLIFAQQPPDEYAAIFTGTTALTIQQPATNARQVQFKTAWFYCVASQTVTLSWNGAAATATAGTALKLPPTFRTAVATVWTASNTSGGTTGPVYTVPAGVTFPIDLSVFRMGTSGSGTNFTFTPNGSCTMNVTWQESQ